MSQPRQARISAILTREETLFLLKMLQVPTMLGIQEPPNPPSPDQVHMQMRHASHSLRARGFARLQNGELLVARDLLEMMSVCAFPHQTLLMNRWSADGALVQAFGHLRAQQVVMHSYPQPALDLFHPLEDRRSLIALMLDLGHCSALPSGPADIIEVNHETLARWRKLGDNQCTEELYENIRILHASAQAADQLTQLLTQPHETTQFHTLHTIAENQALAQSFTLIHTQTAAWLATHSDDSGESYQLQAVNSAQLHMSLYQALAPKNSETLQERALSA